MGDVFAQYPTASWRVGDGAEPLFFPVETIEETGGNRIIAHERAGREGAKLQDTGATARRWKVTGLFNTSIEEGVQNGVPLYPQRLRQILKSFGVHETGVLVLPTTGKVRARAESYIRREAPDDQDGARYEFVFVEDNEDALERAQLQPPTVVATLMKLAEQTTFTAQQLGVWNEDVKSLRELCSEVETMLLAPGRAAADLTARVRSARRSIQSVLDTAAAESQRTGVFGEPRGSTLERQLRILLDRQAAAEDERTSSRPRTKAYVVDVELTSILEIAARIGQDAEDLLELNAARVDDPFTITRGQVLRVFESAPR